MIPSNPVMYVEGGVLKPLEISRYPDQMPLVKSVGLPEAIILRTTDVAVFMATMWWVDSLRDQGDLNKLVLFLPLVPGSRQDRLPWGEGDQLFTAKSIAREVNLREFTGVVCYDNHSDVSTALIDRCFNISAARLMQEHFGDIFPYDGVISPDAGAEKRASLVATEFGKPLYHGWKKRDISTGQLSGFGVESIPNYGKYLVVDDLCDGGGTFIGLAEAIQDGGPDGAEDVTLDLWVTHGLFTKGLTDLQQHYRTIISSDSVPKSAAVAAGNLEQADILSKLIAL